MFKKAIEWVKKLFKSSFFICNLLKKADQSKAKTILLTRPDHDPTTSYLFAWAKPIIDFIQNSAVFNLTCLEKEEACRNRFLEEIKKSPAFIFLNGHGTAHSVTGFNNEPLVTMGSDEALFKDKVTYALSCKSARSLGDWLIDSGAKTYLGYTDDFIFIVEENKINDPLSDMTAKLYLEPSNILVKALLEGKTTGEARQKCQDKYQENINALLTTESQEDDKDLVPYLYWDMQHQVCLGSTEATI